MVDNTEVSWLNSTLVRGFLGRALDGIIYWLLGLCYKIFFNVASAELFTNETVKNFFGRVQLILGVFMIFKLAVSIIKGIINPDSFTDKNNGMGNIVTRIIFTLVMLTIVVPINIPNPQNEYEIQLNNNGLLFGTLYSLQSRILENNTLGRLILGTSDGLDVTSSSGSTNDKLDQAANLLTSTILKGFIRINVKDEDNDVETNSDNWVCPDKITSEVLEVYTDLTAEPSKLLSLTSITCDSEDANWWQKIWGTNERYAFAYKWGISAVVGIIFVYILINFTIDIAVRAIKLAILRLIAPVPIISYMDPSGQKKMFDSWVKQLTSTYIDLFIRLAIIYFVIFLIQDIIVNGLVVNTATGAVGVFTYVFIFLGLFVFAKQAPKFIRDLFGMKDGGGGWFKGLGESLGIAGGIAGVGAATIGSAVTGYKATEASRAARGLNPNGFANVVGAIAQGGKGGAAAIGAFAKAKDHQWRTVTDDSIARNNRHYNLYNQGASAGGMISSKMRGVFGGDTVATSLERQAQDQKAFADYYKHATAKADVDDTWTTATGETVKALKENFERTKLSGADVATQARAEKAYKDAQAALLTDVMRGRYTTGGQSAQIRADFEQAQQIVASFQGTDYELSMRDSSGNYTAGAWKGAQFTALDNEYAIKDSRDYKVAKANDQGAGVGGKK